MKQVRNNKMAIPEPSEYKLTMDEANENKHGTGTEGGN